LATAEKRFAGSTFLTGKSPKPSFRGVAVVRRFRKRFAESISNERGAVSAPVRRRFASSVVDFAFSTLSFR
ncbi:MAG: hypothetical protein IJE77_05250, partial [Thermoguttaceae bacterium]|nr:hypothetical protein [Thermoguttaceae bacterium]